MKDKRIEKYKKKIDNLLDMIYKDWDRDVRSIDFYRLVNELDNVRLELTKVQVIREEEEADWEDYPF